MAEADPQTVKKTKPSFMTTLIEWLLATLIAGGAGATLTAMHPASTAEIAARSQGGQDRAWFRHGEGYIEGAGRSRLRPRPQPCRFAAHRHQSRQSDGHLGEA